MKNFLSIIFLFLIMNATAYAQSLDFLGLTNVKYGMKLETMQGAQLLMDSSSSYTDTALYLRNSRCQMYYRPKEELKLTGFTASRIEYEFCDGELGYVFVYVSGKTEISNALAALKIQFPKMSCGKDVGLGTCNLIDTHNRQLRMIVRINHLTNEMNFVLIPRKAAK